MKLSSQAVLRVAGIAAVVMLLDQLTKYLALRELGLGNPLVVVPGLLSLTLHFNPGVAFGMFADFQDGARLLVLSLTTAAALALVLYFLLTDYREDPWGQTGLAMVLGGAGGNIVDRVRLGQVVDFLDFYLGSAHWPAFNVADSFICLGVGLLMLRGVCSSRNSCPQKGQSEIAPLPQNQPPSR